MARGYAKLKSKIPSPRARPSGRGNFPSAASPKTAPLKTRIYTKEMLRQDPSAFGAFGFGTTGLMETPSLLGMSKRPRR